MSTAEVVTDVEVPEEQWAPVPTQPGLQPPATVLFVDGVRRVDAQVWVDEGVGTVAPGLCASYAAGIVCCCERDGAHLAAFEVRRSLVTAARDAEKIVTWAGTYDVVAAAAPHRSGVPAQLLSAALQVDLAKVETRWRAQAREEASGRDDLLVLDGQLKGAHPLPRAIGFVKSHRHDATSTARSARVVGGLAAGERTPVFRHRAALPACSAGTCGCPAGSAAPWAGVVRVECGARPRRPPAAIALADLAQVTLVRYASAEYKDARAPQNLYPIAGWSGSSGGVSASPPCSTARCGPRPPERALVNVAATHRSSTASWQLASSSACSTASGLRPIARCALRSSSGTEHGLAVERRGAGQVEVGDHQPQRLEPDHAHAAGQAGRPVPLQTSRRRRRAPPTPRPPACAGRAGARSGRPGSTPTRARGEAVATSNTAAPRADFRKASDQPAASACPTSLWVTATPPHLPNVWAHRRSARAGVLGGSSRTAPSGAPYTEGSP